MDILTLIKNLLEELDSNSTDLDIDHIKSVLSDAYQTTLQGLKLSNDAKKYCTMKKEFDTISSNYSVVSEELQSLKEVEKTLRSSLEELNPIVVCLRNDLQGKLSLISKYSPERKSKLEQKIVSCSISDLVDLKSDIESDFNNDWDEFKSESFKANTSEKFVDFTPFKIGD